MFVSMLDLYFAQDVGRLWDMSRIAIAQMPDIDSAEGAAMFDAVFIVLLPFLAYSLYEDWKDSVENRYKPAKKN